MGSLCNVLTNLLSEGSYVRLPGNVDDEPGADLAYQHVYYLWSVIVKEVAPNLISSPLVMQFVNQLVV